MAENVDFNSIDEKLNNDKKLYDTLINIPGAVTSYAVDKDGEIHLNFISESCKNILGFTASECMQKFKDDVFIGVHPQERKMINKLTKEAVKDKKPAACTYRLLCADGQYRWIALNVAPQIIDGVLYFYGVMTNIDDYVKEKQNKLIHEEITNLLLDNNDIIIYDIDFNSRKMILSYPDKDGIRRTRSVIVGELNGSPDVHSEDRHIIKEVYKICTKEATAGSCEYRAKYFSDTYEWYSLYYKSFEDDNGNVYRMLGKAKNIQLEKTLEQRYQEEVAKRKVLETECLAAFTLNITKNELVSYRSDKIGFEPPAVGKNSDEAIKYLAEQIPNKTEALAFEKMFSAAYVKSIYDMGQSRIEIEYRRNNGHDSVIWMKSVGNIIVQPETKDLMIFIYTSDIHDAKMHEIVMANVLSKTYESILLIDAKHLSSKTMSVCDGYDGEYYAYAEDYNKTIHDYMLNACIDENVEEIAQQLSVGSIVKELEDKSEYTVLYTVKAANSEMRKKKVSFRYADKDNYYIVSTLEDVTKIYEVEQQKNKLLENALVEAEKANNAKTEFLSRMSHDIRTPMNAIIGMTGLAMCENNPPETMEYLSNIDSSSHFLLGLINDILDLSKIESGQIELSPQPYELCDFSRAINTVIKPLLDKKNIEFIFRMNCGSTCIFVDKLRFNQIFFNLLSNAAKFTPEGGKVEFTSEFVERKGEVYHSRIYVKDNGIGMSEEYLPHIFESFTQENSSDNVQGTGLGLPIVKSIIDKMGGTIEVKSELGKGTEFIVDLYFKRAAAQRKTSENGSEYEHTSLMGKHILLVEDNELNVIVARKLLEKKGCIVAVAGNGQLAIEKFSLSQEFCYDAILMDVRMPVMNGLDATKAIRQLDRADAKIVPVIAMTADAFVEEQKSMLNSGMNAHIAKPVVPEIMYETISKYIAESRQK